MSDSISRIQNILQCPMCGKKIENITQSDACASCGARYSTSGKTLRFLRTSEEENSTDILRSFFKHWPGFYYFVATVFGPLSFLGVSPRRFLERFPKNSIVINVGSGPKKLDARCINVDIGAYEGVDVVADICRLPFETGSVDGVVCDNVLEHVDAPEAAVAELRRVLKPGGAVYICTPFLYSFHASPNDYQRWTTAGLKKLLVQFEIEKIGTRSGVFSSLCVLIAYLVATTFSFGVEKLFWLLLNISFVAFFPIKLLDYLFWWFPFTEHSAAALYIVARK